MKHALNVLLRTLGVLLKSAIILFLFRWLFDIEVDATNLLIVLAAVICQELFDLKLTLKENAPDLFDNQ